METPLIQYNLRDRDRQYRGADRNYNIPALVKAINSNECQERVEKGDMLGYYGHWARIKFGMNPVEGGLDITGKAVALAPAIKTTYLHAKPDGTVQHKAQFLNTDSGKIAANLYESRAGGFSSAIGFEGLQPQFYGFDYVLEPNYSTNRGYTLDSVNGMTLDQVEDLARGEQIEALLMLLDSVKKIQSASDKTILSLREENEELLSLMAKHNVKRRALDSTYKAPLFVSKTGAERMLRDCRDFNNTSITVHTHENNTVIQQDPLFDRLNRAWG